MWEFSAQLIGSIGLGLFNDTSSAPNTKADYLAIKPNIENTALLGSSDLNYSFALGGISTMTHGYDHLRSKRAQFIQFSHGRNLSDLIQELAFNWTVSLTNDGPLA
jgi:hypothetical protein